MVRRAGKSRQKRRGLRLVGDRRLIGLGLVQQKTEFWSLFMGAAFARVSGSSLSGLLAGLGIAIAVRALIGYSKRTSVSPHIH